MSEETKVLQERIASLLEKNSRLTAADLAVLLGVHEEVVTELITEMEQEHIICGYQTLINWDKTNDSDVSAVIELRVTPQRGVGFDRVAEQIYQYPEIEALYLMSGSYDFMVILRKAPMKEIAQFVNRLAVLDDVVSTATHVVLSRYKDHGTVFVRGDEDRRMVMSQ